MVDKKQINLSIDNNYKNTSNNLLKEIDDIILDYQIRVNNNFQIKDFDKVLDIHDQIDSHIDCQFETFKNLMEDIDYKLDYKLNKFDQLMNEIEEDIDRQIKEFENIIF